MSSTIETTTGLYVYSFLRARDQQAIKHANLRGIEDAAIDVLTYADLAVAVSPIVAKKIRPQRKFLAAHQEIVTQLSKNWSALPVAFGLIADNEEQIQHILSANQRVLAEQIDRVEGQVEMSVALRWTAENVPKYFVDRYPELAVARDAIAAGTASRDDQIEMGRTFERLLNNERLENTQKFLDGLRPITTEIDVQPTRQDSEVMRLACLIKRERENDFNQAIYQIATQFSDDFAISFNGPWPAYSFVKLALSME
jgi:hypothetical protein